MYGSVLTVAEACSRPTPLLTRRVLPAWHPYLYYYCYYGCVLRAACHMPCWRGLWGVGRGLLGNSAAGASYATTQLWSPLSLWHLACGTSGVLVLGISLNAVPGCTTLQVHVCVCAHSIRCCAQTVGLWQRFLLFLNNAPLPLE